jgi:YfiR/HmsC-like
MGLLGHIMRRELWRRIALLVIASGLAGAAAPVSEYQVKAVFLFNFAQFVEWPTSAFPHPNAPFVIGVLGQDPFGGNLDEVVRGESVNKRPLAVARFHDVAEVRDCQILFISATELPHLEEILAALKGRSILTVTDANDPGERGVMIALVTQDSKIRLRIDLQAAKAGNLTISSKLLRPAEIVGAARS